jgi:hypothetical protein
MKILSYFLISAVVILSAVCDYSFISESLMLPETSLLWVNGRIAGWVEIILLCIIMDLFVAVPAFMIWNMTDDLKSE